MAALLIDIFRLCEERGSASGDFDASELPRLAEHDGKFTRGRIHWEAEGNEGRRGLPGAILRISGTLEGTCCRCGAPLQADIRLETPFLFAKSEREADLIPITDDEEEEIVVGSTRFDVADWVEEEVLLKLPLYPSHERCDAPRVAGAGEDDAQEERINPFAVLSSLKKH
ncbi:MAG: DUF177 domain-containing protein [Sutterellaceae bacterium]|nr:DUF177 domain-containing protein [Sutterellaceae bacterium]MDD7441279.1 DUF177 domain-containing protein [Sutterellaceae bacterium]MDY2868850.1 DUF177 domain-containing protein [Mesosutterella sp.]